VQTYVTRLLTELQRKCTRCWGLGAIFDSAYINSALLATWRRYERLTCTSRKPKRARFWPPPVWSCPTGHWQHSINGPKGGQPAFASRRSHWRSIPTRSDSSRSSPVATVPSPIT
jgi:hypothetical protein